jgi:hypothetical protein
LGPFIAFSIFVNTSPTRENSENLTSHLLYKRGEGEVERHLRADHSWLSSILSPSLSPFVLSFMLATPTMLNSNTVVSYYNLSKGVNDDFNFIVTCKF